jgi:hypothetical protein
VKLPTSLEALAEPIGQIAKLKPIASKPETVIGSPVLRFQAFGIRSYAREGDEPRGGRPEGDGAASAGSGD